MINVTKTYLPDIEIYKSYVGKIYKSGWLTNNGEILNCLEKKLEQYLGVKNIVLVANATLGLQIAYKLLNLTGEVITTPFSFVATTSSLLWQNINPVFSDIDKSTYNIDIEKIEKKITNLTSAILPVHVFGNACDVEKIEKLSMKYNLKVIYDAAHAFNINYKNKSILNYGDISVVSFHSTKLFHTIEGGAIIINDNSLYKKAKSMINFGFEDGEIKYLGINAKMNEFQAAMGMCVLEDINNVIASRKEIYMYYLSKLKNMPQISLQLQNKHANQNYTYLPILLESEEKLVSTIEVMNLNGIYPRRYFYPSLNTLEYINCKETMEISENISRRILCLPLYDSLEKSDVDIIVNILNSI
ncbi:DegT/DnrJ/EryC1/StrS family aminotransferase [Clostridioides difficile]|nr:DegT/DnrJ/EryC1/StrS family aminotransferase [Clostridioides difficile]